MSLAISNRMRERIYIRCFQLNLRQPPVDVQSNTILGSTVSAHNPARLEADPRPRSVLWPRLQGVAKEVLTVDTEASVFDH